LTIGGITIKKVLMGYQQIFLKMEETKAYLVIIVPFAYGDLPSDHLFVCAE
jgi:hypothetical protein